MIWTTAQVALGGAIGAAMRFVLSSLILRASGLAFPLGVLSVNILGCFVMGLLLVWSTERNLPHMTPFLMTGILGGFTTFSAFSLEAFTLYDRGAVGAAATYVGLSVVGSLAALVAGVWLGRGIWA